MDKKAVNPLQKHFRQPAIYLALPSKGEYYAADAIDYPETGEIPVFPLTARDEITLKTPDALINGMSVVQVIESCLPNIKNAWALPSIDLDAIFIAIRIASYGHNMSITASCPHCKQSNDYELDLRNALSKIESPKFGELLSVQSLKIKFKPQPYNAINKLNSLQYEEQRLMSQISNSELPEADRIKIVKEQMQVISEVNLQVLADGTDYIQTSDNQIVNDRDFIFEFYQNADSRLIKEIESRFRDINKNAGAKPELIICGDCQKEFMTGIEFDYSNFFGNGS